MNGKVYLVGAGPGDPELLTIKALRILREAELVLHDDLVPSAILNLAPPGAEVANVGKRCGRKSVSQEQIHARMIAGARQGLAVVRLKGGDPAVFARLGEEVEALREAEVEFEIVPGVSAASAASASAGISLTHRRVASKVLFLTGHPGAGKVQDAQREWSALNSENEGLTTATLVVYMPGPDYSRLQDRLVAAGVGRETPCLLVSAASTGASRTHRTTVERLGDIPAMPTPNILIVGAVVRLAQDTRMTARSFPWQAPTPPAILEWINLQAETAG
ncbi:MAG TPA: uroporphyrinogen-III C-methyltransferase [Terriglobia bacterium]